MIVVSASLKKSGSGWFFNLTNDMLQRAGHDDVRTLRRQFGLEQVLLDDNCRINPNVFNLARLIRPHRRGHSFVVKTHAGPTRSLRSLMALGVARATYIFRDPRDVVLSALDHGARLRRSGTPNDLAKLYTMLDAVRYVRDLLAGWEAWTAASRTLVFRYEDLVDDPLAETRRLAAFLDLELTDDDLQAVITHYEEDRQADDRLHFNQGIVRRYQRRMTQPELDLCEQHFGPFLERMGYPA